MINKTDTIDIIQSQYYTIVKIPREVKPVKRQQKSFADFEGILSDVPEFKGKSSVEVQHMIPKVWEEMIVKKQRSS